MVLNEIRCTVPDWVYLDSILELIVCRGGWLTPSGASKCLYGVRRAITGYRGHHSFHDLYIRIGSRTLSFGTNRGPGVGYRKVK